MTTLKEIKGVIASLPDDYKFMYKRENGSTYWAKIEIDTENKALIIGG